MNSKRKGNIGEREAASFLREHGFSAARRGCQFRGSPDSPDVTGVPGWHLEIKRTERFKLRDAVAQASGDSGGKLWCILHRWNNGKWLAVLPAEDWLDLVRETLPPQTISTPLPASCDTEHPAEPQATETKPNCNQKETDMKLTEAFPSKWLKAADLEGQSRLVTIESVKLEVVEEGKPAKPVVILRGMTQGLVLNKTNGNTIASFLGDDTDAWTGKKIVLFPTQAEFQGRMTDCIRVRQPKPAPAAPVAAAPAPTASRPSKAAEELPAATVAEDDVPF